MLARGESSYEVSRLFCDIATERSVDRFSSLLQLISNGTLIIHTPAHTYRFGEQKDTHEDAELSDAPVAELTVRNPNFWLRLCAMGDLGFSEAYMYGEIDCEDLVKVFLVRPAFCLQNESFHGLIHPFCTGLPRQPSPALSN